MPDITVEQLLPQLHMLQFLGENLIPWTDVVSLLETTQMFMQMENHIAESAIAGQLLR
jgi:hypothetical protein